MLDDKARAAIGKIVTDAMKGLGYRGVGTVEFLFEGGEFYFIEMNTRLQVEHPVTEAITGIDLVREQIRVAQGEKLSFTQDDVGFNGHAIECRINAENPRPLPRHPGWCRPITRPAAWACVWIAPCIGLCHSAYYDSLIGKLIVHADDREACLMRLNRALGEFAIDGVETTIPLFEKLLPMKISAPPIMTFTGWKNSSA